MRTRRGVHAGPSVPAAALLYVGALILVATCGGAASPAASPSPGSTAGTSGQTTQVSRGDALYLANCARCHGAQGEGDIGPKLIGGSNLAGYQTAEGMYAYVSRTMPFDQPGSLSESEYLDILAFLLEANDLLPESIELTRANAPGVTTDGQ